LNEGEVGRSRHALVDQFLAVFIGDGNATQ
jgi:hypothetical protein